MKKTYRVTLAVITFACAASLFAAERQISVSTCEVSSGTATNEVFLSNITKVFSVKDGEARYQAYMVRWRGQDVVANDPLVKSDYKVGDTITVLMSNLPCPKDSVGPRLISFTVQPPRPQPLRVPLAG